MSVAAAFLKRDCMIATSYKAAFTVQLLGIFAVVPIFYFIGKTFAGSESSFLKAYNGNYFAFLLIGVAFIDFHTVSLQTFSRSLRDSQLMGTLEIVLLSPTPLYKMLIYSSQWGYLLTTIRFILYLLIGLFLGVDLTHANLPAAILILILGIMSFASFGIISACFVMMFKQGEGVNALLAGASTFFGGVLYPTSVLPAWIRPIGKLLPITHALEGMRRALLGGASFRELLPQILALSLFALVLLPLSITLFWFALERTKVTGTLEQY